MKMNVYQPGPVMALMNPGSYTPEISDYLQAERALLRTYLPAFATLIEAGCADGRYRAEALTAGMDYIGIDYVPVFIDSARLQHPGSRFICGDLQYVLPDLLQESTESALLIFPFNMFGNLRQPEQVIELLAKHRTPVIFLGYDNSDEAAGARSDYYRAAGFNHLEIAETRAGTRFTDLSGLNSIAYSERFFAALFGRHGRTVEAVSFGYFGQAAVSF